MFTKTQLYANFVKFRKKIKTKRHTLYKLSMRLCLATDFSVDEIRMMNILLTSGINVPVLINYLPLPQNVYKLRGIFFSFVHLILFLFTKDKTVSISTLNGICYMVFSLVRYLFAFDCRPCFLFKDPVLSWRLEFAWRFHCTDVKLTKLSYMAHEKGRKTFPPCTAFFNRPVKLSAKYNT